MYIEYQVPELLMKNEIWTLIHKPGNHKKQMDSSIHDKKLAVH